MADGIYLTASTPTMNKTLFGIDLGATQVKGVALVDQKVIERHVIETREDGDWQGQVIQLFQEMCAKAGHPPASVGLSAPGIARVDNRAIAHLPNRLEGLENLNWSEVLSHETWVLNDAHAALLAEARLGVGKGVDNLIMITLGTGVGGGLFINGQIHQGFLQRAGHLGHMSIDAFNERPSITGITGSLEDAIGEVTLAMRSLGCYQTTEDLVKDHLAGDHWATYIWLGSIRKLALAICSLCNTLSPEMVILAGGITQAGDALMHPLNRYMEIYEWRPGGEKTPICIAQSKAFAGAIGAALYGQSRADLHRSPLT